MPCETRWTGDRSLFTGVVFGDGSAYQGQDADLCVAVGLVANAGAGQPVAVSGTLPFLIQNVDGVALFGLFMFLRIAHAPAQYVTDSSLLSNASISVGERPRPACQYGRTWGATFGARSRPGEAWVTPFRCARWRRTLRLKRCVDHC